MTAETVSEASRGRLCFWTVPLRDDDYRSRCRAAIRFRL